jgi:hypothetical protein
MKPRHQHKWGKWSIQEDSGYWIMVRHCPCGDLEVGGERAEIERRLNRDENRPRLKRLGFTEPEALPDGEFFVTKHKSKYHTVPVFAARIPKKGTK